MQHKCYHARQDGAEMQWLSNQRLAAIIWPEDYWTMQLLTISKWNDSIEHSSRVSQWRQVVTSPCRKLCKYAL